MATTKIWAVKDKLKRVLDYASNPEKTKDDDFSFDGLEDVLDYSTSDLKTEKQLYVSGINCSPATALQEMTETKQSAGKTDGVLAFHAVQSFKPGEIDATTAHKVGVELANLMWGKEFEVVVSTHLDKEHLHNHFVVNSVSFKTKKRFTNRHSDYRRFKDLSDALCYQHSLSVIETYHSSKKYNEWLAQKENRTRKRDLIIKDVEYAIEHSSYWKEFIKELEKLDYEIKYGKHIAIRPKGSDRFFRLYKLSDDGLYSEDNIRTRLIENNNLHMETIHVAKRPTYRYNGSFKKQKKLTGFKAMYVAYMYKMGILPKKAPKRKVHFLFKEDLIKMDQFSNEVRFVVKNNINTFDDLDDLKNKLETQKTSLVNQRKVIYNKLKRCNDTDLKVLYEDQKKSLLSNITTINKEIKLCDSVKQRNDIYRKKVEEIKKEQESKQKETENRKTKRKEHEL